MLCLLTMIVGGCGPATLCSAPLPIRMSSEEETRHGDAAVASHVIANIGSRWSESGSAESHTVGGTVPAGAVQRPASDRLRVPTLQMLSVRIQV